MNAEVAELADALRSGRSEHSAREGSNPSFGTKTPHAAGFTFSGQIALVRWIRLL